MKNKGRVVSDAVYLGGEPKNVDFIHGKVYRVLKAQRGDQPEDLPLFDESPEELPLPGGVVCAG